MDVLRLDKQNALVRRLVKKHQDGTLGQPTTESGDPEEASGDDVTEDDTVHFGDTTHNTYTIHEPAQPLVAEKSSGSLLPIILASALGGGGLAAAAIALPALLKVIQLPSLCRTHGHGHGSTSWNLPIARANPDGRSPHIEQVHRAFNRWQAACGI